MKASKGTPAPGQVTRRGKILYSLILLTLLTGLVPLLVMSSQLVKRNREALETAEKLHQLDQTRSIAHQARLYLESMLSQVESISRTFEFGGDSAAIQRRISAASDGKSLLNFIEEGRILSLTVSNRDGLGAYTGYSLDDDRIVSSLRQSFAESLSGKSWVSEPHVSEQLLDTVLIISAPIVSAYDAEGHPRRIEGVASAMISLKPIHELVKAKRSAGRDAYVVDEQGHLVTHSDNEILFTQIDLSNTAIVQEFQEARGQASGSVNFTLMKDGGSNAMLGTYTAIGDRNSPQVFLRNLGWGAIVQAEEDAVYYSARKMERDSYWIASIAGVVAITLGVFFAGRLSQPISQLAEGAHRLATGDFSQNITVKSGNEIGVLADTFNFMVAEIRKYIEQLRKAAEENKEMFLGAVSSLAAAIDAKDPYTAGHSERVAHYSHTIAKVLGLPEKEVETIRIAALMHDVGKIGIEDRILGKAGPLTDVEFEIMKTHPTKGAVIMQQVPHFKDMIPGMKYHHENVDGTGYPEGLKGDEIPHIAKIVSVADTFDAMTTNRPYQKAMEITYVFARMRSFIGKKFDKEIVEALITAYEEGSIRPNMKVKSVIAGEEARPTPPTPPPDTETPPAPTLIDRREPTAPGGVDAVHEELKF